MWVCIYTCVFGDSSNLLFLYYILPIHISIMSISRPSCVPLIKYCHWRCHRRRHGRNLHQNRCRTRHFNAPHEITGVAMYPTRSGAVVPRSGQAAYEARTSVTVGRCTGTSILKIDHTTNIEILPRTIRD